jgi:hypothetical protein
LDIRLSQRCGANLLEYFEQVEFVPMFDEPPVRDPLSAFGQGPFGPSDDNARRLILGEW